MTMRQPDKIVVESSRGVFDRFSSLTITNDLLNPSEATFDIGGLDWPSFAKLVGPGERLRVYLNDQLRILGRAEVNTVDISPQGGLTAQVIVRTRLSDASYATADPVLVKDVSLKQFIVSLYKQLGYSEANIGLPAWTARDLLTGTQGKSGPDFPFEAANPEQAKIQPPESIRDAAARHLRRFNAIHYDAPNGSIVVDRPTAQTPTYKLFAEQRSGRWESNIASLRLIRDWSEVALSVTVQGQAPRKDGPMFRFSGSAVDARVDAVRRRPGGHFYRPVLFPPGEAKTQAQAQAIADRELSARRRRMDGFEVRVDGWTYWDGTRQIPWANNTTAQLSIDPLGDQGAGPYLITRTQLQASVNEGETATLTLTRPDLWTI